MTQTGAQPEAPSKPPYQDAAQLSYTLWVPLSLLLTVVGFVVLIRELRKGIAAIPKSIGREVRRGLSPLLRELLARIIHLEALIRNLYDRLGERDGRIIYRPPPIEPDRDTLETGPRDADEDPPSGRP